jgi:hypothetical protein
MERIQVKLNNDHSVGLGDNLCMLSALANIPEPIDLFVSNDHNTYDRLMQYKKIFRISDATLAIYQHDDRGDFNNVGWPVKLLTEYYRPNFINVNGQTIQPKTNSDRSKKFIAIAGYVDPDPTGNNEWPYSRARPQEYWNRVYAWIKSIGYEAVSVDNAWTSLDTKIEILAKHCRAIISYEGGMAHLSHMLKLPCFLVDWKLPSPSTELGEFHCEFVHKTSSVYILRDDEEIFSWGEGKFNSTVEDLHHGQTNNRLVNGQCKLSFTGPGIQGRIHVHDINNRLVLDVGGMYGDNKVTELLNKHFYQKQLVQK